MNYLGYPPATLLRRLGAALYDALLLAALLIAGTAIAVAVNGGQAVDNGNILYQLWLLAIAALFYGWFWAHGGQTLGMRAWGMHLVNNAGDKASFGQVLIRLPLAFLGWLSLLGLVWCLFDRHGHCLHDRLSNTQVLVVPKNLTK